MHSFGSNNSLASKIPRFTWLPTPVLAHCSTPACLQLGRELGGGRGDVRASGLRDTDGGSPRALKVGGLAGTDARVPDPGPLPHKGAACLLLHLFFSANNSGLLPDAGGSAQLPGQKITSSASPGVRLRHQQASERHSVFLQGQGLAQSTHADQST